MIIRALDANGDWEFGQGINSYKTDQEAIIQNINTKISEWVGDCFFNNNAGIDWNNRLGKNQQDQLNQDLKSLILKCYGVLEFISISSVLNTNRECIINYSIKTIFSPSAQATLTVGTNG